MREARVYEKGVDGTWGEYVGFDPDNVGDIKSNSLYDEDADHDNSVKPMSYFASRGDLPMMRWLYVNGADTRDVDVELWFPMRAAALDGQMEACKWLFDHGAAKDLKRRAREDCYIQNARSPLCATFAFNFHRDLYRWLILNGALCKDDGSGDLDFEIMKQDLVFVRRRQERKLLLEWATDLHRARTSFLLFLSGALSAPKHAYSTRRSASPVRILSGKSGVLELISDYTGIVRGREARIIRQLTELLPSLIRQIDGE
jgi:hypothetical protein